MAWLSWEISITLILNHGVVVLGDFNDFNISNFTCNQNLKQAVKQPTRGSTILDLIVTNLHKLHHSPTVIAPLGSSDHNQLFNDYHCQNDPTLM